MAYRARARILSTVFLVILALIAPFASMARRAQLNSTRSDPSVNQQLFNGNLETVTNSVYHPYAWSDGNSADYRALRGDVNTDGIVDMMDIGIIAAAFNAQPGSPNWNTNTNPPGPDLNGDGIVDMNDMSLACSEFLHYMGHDAYCRDGEHSWYASGGGFMMSQWLDVRPSLALAGESDTAAGLLFYFYFYPVNVASDGSLNNARAEVSWILNDNYTTGIKYGAWVAPTSMGWWQAYVFMGPLPADVKYVQLIMHGKSDFKAWIDSATLDVVINYLVPPYSTQSSDPTNNTMLNYPDGSQIGALGNNDSGLVLVFSKDYSQVGTGKTAYVRFNEDPPVGNSPWGGGYEIGAYIGVWGYLGLPDSAIGLTIDLYFSGYHNGQYVSWSLVDSKTAAWTASQYPTQSIWYFGSVDFAYASPPWGTQGSYAIGVQATAFAEGSGSLADAATQSYEMPVFLIKIT